MADLPNLTMTIKTLRERRQLTQQQIAEVIGVDPSSVRNWEHGRTTITLHHFLQLMDILDCDVNELRTAVQNSGCFVERGTRKKAKAKAA